MNHEKSSKCQLLFYFTFRVNTHLFRDINTLLSFVVTLLEKIVENKIEVFKLQDMMYVLL